MPETGMPCGHGRTPRELDPRDAAFSQAVKDGLAARRGTDPNGDGCQFVVDAKGFVWRTWPDLPVDDPMHGMWSMARVNPDNSPIPKPVTPLVPAVRLAEVEAERDDAREDAETMAQQYMRACAGRAEARAAVARVKALCVEWSPELGKNVVSIAFLGHLEDALAVPEKGTQDG